MRLLLPYQRFLIVFGDIDARCKHKRRVSHIFLTGLPFLPFAIIYPVGQEIAFGTGLISQDRAANGAFIPVFGK